MVSAMKHEDSMNKEKHSLRNFAAAQSQGSCSKKFLPTSIVTFNRKEANFENDIASDTSSVSFHTVTKLNFSGFYFFPYFESICPNLPTGEISSLNLD